MTPGYRKKWSTVISCDVSINLCESVFHQARHPQPRSSDKPMIDLFSCADSESSAVQIWLHRAKERERRREDQMQRGGCHGRTDLRTHSFRFGQEMWKFAVFPTWRRLLDYLCTQGVFAGSVCVGDNHFIPSRTARSEVCSKPVSKRLIWLTGKISSRNQNKLELQPLRTSRNKSVNLCFIRTSGLRYLNNTKASLHPFASFELLLLAEQTHLKLNNRKEMSSYHDSRIYCIKSKSK